MGRIREGAQPALGLWRNRDQRAEFFDSALLGSEHLVQLFGLIERRLPATQLVVHRKTGCSDVGAKPAVQKKWLMPTQGFRERI